MTKKKTARTVCVIPFPLVPASSSCGRTPCIEILNLGIEIRGSEFLGVSHSRCLDGELRSPSDRGRRLVRPRGGAAISLGLARSLKLLHRANLSPVEIDIVQSSVWNSPAIPSDSRPVAVFEWNPGHGPVLTPFTRLGSIIIHDSSSHEDMAPIRCPFFRKTAPHKYRHPFQESPDCCQLQAYDPGHLGRVIGH
jgi:hypothetical protein